MKIKLIGLLTLTVIFISYSKNNNMNVVLKTDGSLSVKATDNEGKSISNTKVKLYEGVLSSDYLNALNTDVNGEVFLGEVIFGSYTLDVDTPKVNGIKYIPIKPTQIISGLSSKITINVQRYSGTLKRAFKKSSYLGGGFFSGLNAIIEFLEGLYNKVHTARHLNLLLIFNLCRSLSILIYLDFNLYTAPS